MPKKDTSKSFFSHYTVAMRSADLPFGAYRPRTMGLEKASWVRSLVCLAVFTLISSAAGFAQSQIGNGLPYPPPTPGSPPMNRTANPTADANRLMEDSMKLQDNLKRIEEINVLRQKEMTLAASVLIQLANQVKTSTDKGKPDATSIMDLRKVELIEKLAHNIQNKMRATVSN